MHRSRSSRRRYLSFVEDYKRRRLDEVVEAEKNQSPRPQRKPREALLDYLRWLWPHRLGVGALFALALLAAGIYLLGAVSGGGLLALLRQSFAGAKRHAPNAPH